MTDKSPTGPKDTPAAKAAAMRAGSTPALADVSPEELAAAEEHRQKIADEYGQFVAVADIHYQGSLAYTKGMSVPAANVARHGYLKAGLVRRVDEKEKA
jgi:hypothetical protein